MPIPRCLSSLAFLLLGSFVTLAFPVAAGAQAPAAGSADEKPMLFEAEFPRANGDVKVEKDPDALSGKYAMHPRDYEPVFIHNTPAKGNECVVWVRSRGVPLQLKSINEAGEQTELTWVYDAPAAWTWMKVGVFSRKKLGKQILLIRGPDAKPDAGLDAVILCADADFDPASIKDGKGFDAIRVHEE